MLNRKRIPDAMDDKRLRTMYVMILYLDIDFPAAIPKDPQRMPIMPPQMPDPKLFRYDLKLKLSALNKMLRTPAPI